MLNTGNHCGRGHMVVLSLEDGVLEPFTPFSAMFPEPNRG